MDLRNHQTFFISASIISPVSLIYHRSPYVLPAAELSDISGFVEVQVLTAECIILSITGEVYSMIPVLFTDDNKELCYLFREYLEDTGEFSVHLCHNGFDTLTYLQNHSVMVVISDYDMPEMNGIDLLRQIRMHHPRLPFIMLTGNDSKETAIAALNAGADFYQNKGEDFEVQVLDLSHKIRILAERHQAEEAAGRKEKILAAISYAAERLLKGSGWQEDMEEILGHLGRATCAGSVFVAGCAGSSGTAQVTDPVIWHEDEEWVDTWILDPAFHEWWQDPKQATLLEDNKEIVLSPGFLPGDDPDSIRNFPIATLLLIPIFLDNQWWGVLGITDSHQGRIFSTEEVNALRMAAGVIGSARYRMYIEEFFRNPVEESLVGVFLMRDFRFVYVNPRFCDIFGYPRDILMNAVYPQNLIHPESRDDVIRMFRSVQAKEIPSGHYEVAGQTADSRKIFLEMYLTIISCDGIECLIGNVMDVTDRYYARKALYESEKRFRELYSGIQDLVLIHRLPEEGGAIIEVNQSASDTLSYDADLFTSMTLPDLCHTEHERETCTLHCVRAADIGTSGCQTVFFRNDESPIPVDLSTKRVVMRGKSVLLTVARNDTERTLAEAKIRAGEELLKRNMLLSIREKETLLREIHHRVKNNMQIIISLLKLQDYKSDDPSVHEIIRDCRNRIYSMAVIHEKLYQTDELTSIRLEDYLKDIAGRIIHEFDTESSRIHLTVSENSSVLVDINTGIPLGLIINELITNSMKYAFDPGAEGEIRIHILQKAEHLIVTVTDSGRGLPQGFNGETADSMGTELIRGLAFQLGGVAVWTSGTGTTCTLTVPHHSGTNMEIS